jgi:hypothetical protein
MVVDNRHGKKIVFTRSSLYDTLSKRFAECDASIRAVSRMCMIQDIQLAREIFFTPQNGA